MGKLGGVVSTIYVILGLYLLNLGFNFFAMPEVILNFERWINIISGVLLVLGAYFFYKYNTVMT